MSRHTKVIIGVVWLLAMAGLLFWVFRPPPLSDEEQIHAALDHIERGIEQGKSGDVLGVVAHDYSDSQGMTYDSIRDGLLYAFRHNASFDIVLAAKSLKIEGDTATVQTHVKATVVWGRNQSVPYEADVTLTFERKRAGWRCVNAEGWHKMEWGMEEQGGL